MLIEDTMICCPACREELWIEIDVSEGDVQDFIQDCEVCCRPLRIQAQREGDRFRAVCELSA